MTDDEISTAVAAVAERFMGRPMRHEFFRQLEADIAEALGAVSASAYGCMDGRIECFVARGDHLPYLKLTISMGTVVVDRVLS